LYNTNDKILNIAICVGNICREILSKEKNQLSLTIIHVGINNFSEYLAFRDQLIFKYYR